MTPEAEADWLAERAKSMGGSDIAAAGSGRYGGATKAVASKLGIEVDDIDPELADRGHRWEHPVADGVLAHTGLYVVGEQMLVRNPATPHIHATLDGMLHHQPAGVTLADIELNLEIKTRARYSPWPRDYWHPQCQVGMWCTGARRCLLAIATIDSDYDPSTGRLAEQLVSIHYEWVERDEYEIARLVELGTWLWGHVERGELPEPTDGSALPYVKAANMKAGRLCPDCGGFGTHTGGGRRKKCATCEGKGRANIDSPPVLGDELSALIERREELAAAVKASEDEAAMIEAKLRLAIGEATEVVTADGAWRVRCGLPIRKFTSQSEVDFLELHRARAEELGLLRTVLDRKKAEELMAEEFDALRIATPDRRLTTKLLRPEETPL
ncbi:MAG: YqaJ viral recombinase family protein [Candidatus Neomicrothrix subdominans]